MRIPTTTYQYQCSPFMGIMMILQGWEIIMKTCPYVWVIKSRWLYIGYFFFAFLWTEIAVKIYKLTKKEQGQYPAILNEQAWSIKDLFYGFWGNFFCGTRRVVLSLRCERSSTTWTKFGPLKGVVRIRAAERWKEEAGGGERRERLPANPSIFKNLFAHRWGSWLARRGILINVYQVRFNDSKNNSSMTCTMSWKKVCELLLVSAKIS